MKVTQDKIENRQAYLTIEMEPAEVEAGLKKAYNRLVQKANVPGFRKGKTPRPILEQYIGTAALLEEAVEIMAPEAFDKAAKEKELKVITRPEIQLEKTDPVIYKMVVPLEPAIKLGDYKSVRIAPEVLELKEEDFNKTIEQLRHQHAIFEPVERQVNSHDLVILDIESKIGEQPYINQKDAEFEVEKDSEFPMKGFAEALIGLKSGETKEFKLSFSADHTHPELAGKEAAFKVAIKEVKQQKLPELNDDLAKQVDPNFKTLDDLNHRVRETLKSQLDTQSKQAHQQKVIDAVVAQAELDYPAFMVEEEIDGLIKQQMQRWRLDEKGMEEYLNSIKKTSEQLRDEVRPAAIRNLRQSLVLTQVAKQEEVKIEQAEMDTEIQSMLKEVGVERKTKLLEFLSLPQSQMNVASSIVMRKTLNILTDIAQGIAPKVAEVTQTSETKAPEAVETPKSETK